MQIHFQSDPLLGPDDLNVTVNAVAKNDKVIKLLNYLDKYNQKSSSLIPIKTEDRILTIKQTELIKVEVTKNILSFYTKTVFRSGKPVLTTVRLFSVCDKNKAQSAPGGVSAQSESLPSDEWASPEYWRFLPASPPTRL